MTIFKIDTPQEFFQHIVSTDVSVFLNNEPALRTAYHACNSLLSYRDWIFATQKGKPSQCLRTALGPLSSKRQFQKALELADPGFAIVADIANASKHLILEADRVGAGLRSNGDIQVEHIDGTFDNGGPFGSVPFGQTIKTIYVVIGQHRHDVVVSVGTTYETWVKLNAENRW
jgi:hypothetical protein